MKKINFLSLIFVFMFSSLVQASEWSYDFVIWDGKKYEVKEERIEESEIGNPIGKVKTEPYYSRDDSESMKYYGNASNTYSIGTRYFEIKGIPTSDAIAIKEDNHWMKAVYVSKAPFHIMNMITNPFFIFSFILIVLFLMGIIIRTKKLKFKNNVYPDSYKAS